MIMQLQFLFTALTETRDLLVPGAAVFGSALVAGLLLTALMRKVAPRLGLVDRPDGHRKLHRKPIPMGGGAAVFLAAAIVLVALFVVPSSLQQAFQWRTSDLMALLMASAAIVVLGLVDDRIRMRGRQKLIGQILAVSILVANGLVIRGFAIFGWEIDLGLLAIPVTYFWMLGAINSVNLLDGIDGLASILGIILVATFAGLALMTGRAEVAMVALAFAGALCGFLRFNFPPATIFLGDAGSMLIGLVVGALAIHGSLKGAGTVLLAAPMAVWILPILDSSAAILRRRLTGRSLYATDRGHLHHRLMERFGSNRKVLAAVAICAGFGSAAALLSVALHNDLVALCVGASLVVILVASGLFGRVEFLLVWNHLKAAMRSVFAGDPGDEAAGSEMTIRLQGTRPWETLWETLTESAEKLELLRIRFDVNAPLVHEGFNAKWERPTDCDPNGCWHVEMPLRARGQVIGRLTVVGVCNGVSPWESIGQLSEMLDPLHGQLQTFFEPITPATKLPASPPADPVRPDVTV